MLAADGVSVPFRPDPGTAKGKISFHEVKLVVLARLKHTRNREGNSVTRLQQRRFVAGLGNIDALQPRLQLEALYQGSHTVTQVVWISDGA